MAKQFYYRQMGEVFGPFTGQQLKQFADAGTIDRGTDVSHVLVSAQACFLPIPKEGTAEFNPVLFNYQSRAGDPAVLAILATREGTSVTVIDNERDAFEAGGTWGQRLFFNQNGERASLTGKRKSDYLAEATASETISGGQDQPSDREGLNMVLMIQVPLKQKEPMRFQPMAAGSLNDTGILCCCMSAPSDVEEAVISHGAVEGPFPIPPGKTSWTAPPRPPRRRSRSQRAAIRSRASSACAGRRIW